MSVYFEIEDGLKHGWGVSHKHLAIAARDGYHLWSGMLPDSLLVAEH